MTRSYTETKNFAGLISTAGKGPITVDIVRTLPCMPGCQTELIDLLAPVCAEAGPRRVQALIACDQYFLLEDLQAIGFGFRGYLAQTAGASGRKVELWAGAQKLKALSISELGGGHRSGRILRCVLEFQHILHHDPSARAEDFVRYCCRMERYLAGISAVPRWEITELPAAGGGRPLPHAPMSGRREFSAFADVVRRRVSTMGFSREKDIRESTLNDIIRESFVRRQDGRRPFGTAGGLGDYSLYLAPKRVSGLAESLYRVDPESGAFATVQAGFKADAIDAATFSQKTVRDAGVWAMLTADPRRLIARYGCRAYRFMFLDGGGLLHQLHLSATSFGVGFRILGGFDDRLVAALLKLREGDVVVGCAAFGLRLDENSS